MALPIRPPRPDFSNQPEEQKQAAPQTRLPANPVLPVPSPQPAPVYQPEPEPYVAEEAEERYEEIYVPQQNTPEPVEYEEEPYEQPEPVQQQAVEYSEEDYDLSPEEEEIQQIINSLSPKVKESAAKLIELIGGDDSSEVLMNGPHDIIFKRQGQRYFAEDIDFETIDSYHKVINALILPNTDTADRIGESSFLIEGQLELPDLDDPDNSPPLVARVHIIAPPAVAAAKVTIAKKARHQFTLDDLLASGTMSPGMNEFMKALARGRVTTVFSGLSGSGKTTLLEAMSHHFDPNDRVIVVEDTAELRLPIADVVPLRSTSAKPGMEAKKVVSLEWLVAQANRMRPDRIIVGEVRGGEMAEFLMAANSGADGSMTTVHASSPRQTIDKIVSMANKSDSAKSQEAIYRDIASTIQIVVQTALIDGQHIVLAIEEVSNTVTRGGSGVASTTIFEYDRNANIFRFKANPSDELTSFLGQRGVAIDRSWFTRGV